MTTTRFTASRGPSAQPAVTVRRIISLSVFAAAANGVIFALGRAAGASMEIESGPYSRIGLPLVLLSSLIPLLLAGLVTRAITRLRPRFRVAALWVGLTIAVLSMISPFVVAQDLATAVSLAAMHLVVAAAWLVILTPGQGER